MMIDIGGGTLSPRGYINLDPAHGAGEWRRRVQDGIPVPDGAATRVRASHVMEHIPAGAERIDVFNDVHRALGVGGGEFEVIVPVMVPGRWEPIADPTHVSFWVPESFHYFDGSFAPHASYGIRPWQTLTLEMTDVAICRWVGVPR